MTQGRFPKQILSVVILGSVALGLFVVFVIATPPAATAAPPKQGPPDRPSLSRGAALWIENCAPCHGVDGQGDGPTADALEHKPPDFSDPTLARERTLADMVEVTTNGRIERLMPPWGNQLSEQQIWDVVTYAQNFSTTPSDLEAGQQVYNESCLACHGENGVGDAIDFSQPDLLIERSQQDLFDILRAGNGVHSPLNELPDEALWASLVTVRNFSVEAPTYDGRLRAQVRNSTSTELIASQAVTLYMLSPAGQLVQSFNATTDDQGIAIFTDLDSSPDMNYALETNYQGVRYLSPEPTVFAADSTAANAILPVYETTEDSSVVAQSRLHRIMAFGNGEIQIADVHVFVNNGQATYIGTQAADGLPETVRLALPANAIDLSFQPETVRSSGQYFVDSRPLIPGEEIFVSATYRVPIDGDTYLLETPLLYDLPFINMLAGDQGAVLESDVLTFDGLEEFQGNTYQLFSGSDLKANTTLTIDISDLDEVAVASTGTEDTNAAIRDTANTNQTILLWSLLGVGGLVLAFSLFYSKPSPVYATRQTNLEQEKTQLLGFLQTLETLHDNGEVADAAYQQLREQKRSRLKEVLLQLRSHNR